MNRNQPASVRPWLQTNWDWRAALNFIGGGTGTGVLIAATFAGHTAYFGLVLGALASVAFGLMWVWSRDRWRTLPSLIPVVVFSLILIPLVIYHAAGLIGMTGQLRAAVVMAAAMPSMVFGIVLCDRFNLDSTLYAAAVTVTTVLSMLTLPIWHGFLA